MTALPTGTVTFLYTDIEGSTALWQRFPDAMPAVIARHDAILRQAVQTHQGVVFRTVGDAVHAAFVTATNAVAAALAAQRALAAEAWREGITLRVRMALHTGAVDVQDGEYVGHTLNRMARILASGHGRQILLSGATAELVRHALPPDTSLRDMGEHRLKDLTLPEHIYALQAPDLPADFPPLKTLDGPRTNLPHRRGALLGREREMESAEALLTRDDVGLVTFTGAGGTGKTSLAVTAGHRLLNHFPDGVWFVSLASITDPALVPSAIMSTLGLREEGGQSARQVLDDYFASKHLLLILDNFEQVTEAASLVAELLQGAPRLTVLVTSRVSLRLREEHELPIAPLSLPHHGQTHQSQSLVQYAAVQLFTARAQEVKPGFTVTDENAPAVAEICSRLDGLPLAIELAAARIRVLTPQALLARLERRLPLLTGGARDLPVRQQTMEAAIAWSYDQLTEEEQTLYRRISVFAGGFTLEQVEAVCMVDGRGLDVLDGLTSLVDKSLVRQEEVAGEPRFSMLQTIREFGLTRLDECGEGEALHRRHGTYFADLAGALEQAAYALGSSAVYGKVESEWSNFRTALDWSLSESGDIQIAVRLLSRLGWFFVFGEYAPEGRARAEALLAHSDAPEDGEEWADALISAGMLDLQRGNYAAAMAHLHDSEQLLRGSDNHSLLAKLTNWLAVPALNQGDAETAERLFTECRDHSRVAGWRWAEVTASSFVAESMMAQGRLDDARHAAEEALEGYRVLGDAWGTGRMQVLLCAMAWRRGDYPAAREFGSEAVRLLQQVGEPYNLSRALTLLGIVLMDETRYEEAEKPLTESLLNWRTMGNRGGMILSLAGLTAAAAGQGHIERARWLYAAEPLCRADTGFLLDPLVDVAFERFVRSIRERLGDEPEEDLPAVPLEEAVSYALGEPVTATLR